MLLYGNELAGYIKQRQFEQLRSLQHTKQLPRVAVVTTGEVVSNKYIQIKQTYGADIGARVTVHQPPVQELPQTVQQLGEDNTVHGIVVQLPLPDPVNTESVVTEIPPLKDVDGLRPDSSFDPPTPTAILWLLGAYDITLEEKRVGIIGQGRLVGKPLAEMLRRSGVEPLICDKDTGNFEEVVSRSDIIITATGRPNLLRSGHIQPDTVVIDAGTAFQEGALVGDVDPEAYKRNDTKISPVPGGVGPLTVCVLFENLIAGYQEQANG